MSSDRAVRMQAASRSRMGRGVLAGCTIAFAVVVGGYAASVRDAAHRRGATAGTTSPFPATAPAPATQPVAPNLPGQWKLAFHDEFDGTTLAPVWAPHQYWSDGPTVGEGDEQSDPANVAVGDGCLRLTARKDNRFGKPYTGALAQAGGIRGRESRTFSFLYGYAEAAIRVPQGRGLWPAFWLMPASYQDANGEIDVMDNGTGDPLVLHASAIRQGRKDQHPHAGVLSPGFHTFAVDWQADHIAWYIDGAEWARTTDRRLIPTEPMYPIFDLAVGGDWGGPPDAATHFPALMKVDWIRIWQRR